MGSARDQVQAIRSLEENWDGYGAAPTQTTAIELALEFADLIEAMLQKSSPSSALHASPTRTGGVLLEWEDLSRQHEIEILPDGSISFLHLEKETGAIQAQKFSPGNPLAPCETGAISAPLVIPPGFLRELQQSLAA